MNYSCLEKVYVSVNGLHRSKIVIIVKSDDYTQGTLVSHTKNECVGALLWVA